jgi:uncharacterized protein
LLAVLPLVAVLLTGCTSSPQSPAAPEAPTVESVSGEWNGRIAIPASPLDVGIRLPTGDEGLRGEIDIPAQGVAGMPLADVLLQGPN